MGAGQSAQPRSVSMDNPGVMEISDDVVKRLKKGITKQMQENVKEAPAAPAASPAIPAPSKAVESKPKPSAAKSSVTPKSHPAIPQSQTVYVPVGGTLTAMDVRRQKELELQQNDEMWRKRMTDLEETLKKTNKIMEEDLSKSMEDVRKRFTTAAVIHQLPPCQDLKAQLVACYKRYPGETLNCSQEVANFRNCVDLHRIKKLDEKISKAAAEKEAAAKPEAKVAVKGA